MGEERRSPIETGRARALCDLALVKRSLPLLLVVLTPTLAAATRIPLTVHVAQENEAPVASRAWIDAFVEQASTLWAPADCDFEVVSVQPLDTPGPAIESVADRHALAEHAPRDGTVHIFVVSRLADRSREGVDIAGVHWRYRGRSRASRGRRYVILSRSASGVDTAAHELGHFFGEKHAQKPGNLMKQQPRDEIVAFSSAQVRRLRRRVRRAVAQGVVVPIEPLRGIPPAE